MRADLLVTTGGVSAGAYDTVKEVLSRLGHRAVRQGRDAARACRRASARSAADATPIFTLPGNPVSALVSFEVFVRPALRRMRGETRAAPADGDRRRRRGLDVAGRQAAVRPRVPGPDGRTGARPVRPVGGQGSHLVADLAEANCLAVVPEDVTDGQAGRRRCDAWLLERGRR